MIEPTTNSIPGAVPPQYRVLNAADAAMVWVLKWSGNADHVIAHKLGTMPSRVTSILTEQTHVGSKDKATKMIASPEKV